MDRFTSRVAVGVLAALVGAAPAALAREGAAGPAAVRGETSQGGELRALGVVAQFLQLRTDQVPVLVQMLQARHASIAPLLQQIGLREQRIRELLAAGGDPAEIGMLTVQIHQLRQLATAAQVSFLGQLHALLDEAQRGRLAQARVALQLQPVLPAFQALQIL